MDEDTQDAAWAQQEQDERRRREDEMINRMRKDYGSFRAECDAFSADFQHTLKNWNSNGKHQ
jgi:hypothetical protein